MHARRVLPLALALSLAALLLLPSMAGAASEERARVTAGYPLPKALSVGVWEHPECYTHQVLWQGAWFGIADPARNAWKQDPAEAAASLHERWTAAAILVGERTVTFAAGGITSVPAWMEDPFGPLLYVLYGVQDEDACMLTLAQATAT